MSRNGLRGEEIACFQTLSRRFENLKDIATTRTMCGYLFIHVVVKSQLYRAMWVSLFLMAQELF